MCNKRNSRRITINGKLKRIDSCLANIIMKLNRLGLETLSCCCGHGRYPMTIIVNEPYNRSRENFELSSDIDIPRKRRFYLKDKKGYFYIPELKAGGK